MSSPALPSWPSEAAEASASDVGFAAGFLLANDERWVHRRVETIHLLGTELSRRSVSVDFTVPSPLRSFLRIKGTHQSVVPIALLAKTKLRNFDLRDEGNHSVPVLGRTVNGVIATEALVALADMALGDEGRPTLSEFGRRDLEVIATSKPDLARKRLDRIEGFAEYGDREMGTVLSNPAVALVVAQLADTYLLLAVLRDIRNRRILKYSYDQPLEDDRSLLRRTVQGLSGAPFEFDIEVPASAHGSSYHVEIVIPEELRVDYAAVHSREADEAEATIHSEDSDADRAALYVHPVPKPGRRPLLFAQVQGERAGFPTLAASVGLISLVILGVGAWLTDLTQTKAGPAISILLVGSGLFAGAIAQRGEHRLLRTLLVVPRVTLSSIGVLGMVAAALLAFGPESPYLQPAWRVASIVAAVLCSSLCVRLLRSRGTVGRQIGQLEDDN